MTTSEMIKMKVTGLTIDPFTSMPIIILKDMDEKCALPIWIGLIEASAIATELEHIKLTRPMTHDLMKNIIFQAGLTVLKVEVNDLADNTFYAKVTLKTKDREMELDSRPSDAIAIAMRTDAPIYVAKHVIEKSRKIDLSQEESNDDQRKKRWAEILENLSPDDFGKYKM